MWVTRELYNEKWHNYYFDDAKLAKKLMKELLRNGKTAICLRSAL